MAYKKMRSTIQGPSKGRLEWLPKRCVAPYRGLQKKVRMASKKMHTMAFNYFRLGRLSF
jgi:hypothetical protein